MGRSWVHYADGRSWPLWVVTLLLVSALLVVAHRTGFAVGDDPETRHTLGGQHGVYVVVDQFGPDATGKELTREQLQTDVEQLLRTAGIPVLTAAQAEAAREASPPRAADADQGCTSSVLRCVYQCGIPARSGASTRHSRAG